MDEQHPELELPALKAHMGDWIYYSTFLLHGTFPTASRSPRNSILAFASCTDAAQIYGIEALRID